MRKIFITHLAKTAAASFAVAHVNTEARSTEYAPPVVLERPDMSNLPIISDEEDGSNKSESVPLAVFNFPTEWTRDLDKEFRRLSLAEAKGELSKHQALRLNQLDAWRHDLLNPRTSDEILLQLKRDSLLEKMADNFKEYLELKHGSHRKRIPAS